MDRPQTYELLLHDAEEASTSIDEKNNYAWQARHTNIIAGKLLNNALYILVLFLSLSLCLNLLLVTNTAQLQSCHDTGRSIFTGSSFNVPTPYHAITGYWSANISDADMEIAWDTIDTNAMAISLDDSFARSAGLGPSTRFPWDTERSVYYVKGIHDLHCLKLIRKAIVTKHRGAEHPFSLYHLYHCLDGLRQDIMCVADDTPMPAPIAHHVGDGQIRQCRDWNKLIEWARSPDRHACYAFDDYREATNTLELFAFCPPDSPYLDIQQAYFAYHGHKETYESSHDDKATVIF